MVCPLGNPPARHASVQSTYVRVGQDAGLFSRRTTVRELRRPGETGQKQADVAIDNYGPHMTTALVDFVMVHPTAATYVNNYGTSGDAAKIVAGKKVYKYGETCDELGYDLIPFAIETYGKFGKAALKHLKVLQTMALEEGVRCEAGITPWFARSFVDGATWRLALHCNAPLCATNCVVRMCGAPKGTPAVTRATAARTPILMAARAAACVRARSRWKGRLLELGAGVP